MDGITPLPYGLKMIEPSILLPPPNGEAVAVTRSTSSRRAANPDVDMTVQLRRWQTVASSAGMQPYTWGLAGDAAARLALGVQSTLFYTDNLYFQPPGGTKGQTMFEISPIIKLDLGDPQSGISAAGSKQSEYYASLLYVPTFFYHLDEGVDDYAQHFLGETGRVNELSRSVLRVDYDQRKLASSENTSPEENYTLLDISALCEHRITPRTTFYTKGTYRQISVLPVTSNRQTWIGEVVGSWELSPKTKLGLGTELGHIIFNQAVLGTQDYQQAFFNIDWKPSSKFGFTTRTGMEFREFHRALSRQMMTSLVSMSTMFWQATEKTRINARFRVGNSPSVLSQGSLFREIRFGPDIMHDFSLHFYAAADLQVARRHYDTGRLDWEPTSRFTFGYRDDIDKAHNRTNIELFIQWHRRERSDIRNANVERTQAGVQVTRFF